MHHGSGYGGKESLREIDLAEMFYISEQKSGTRGQLRVLS